jgi:hypothetical protein
MIQPTPNYTMIPRLSTRKRKVEVRKHGQKGRGREGVKACGDVTFVDCKGEGGRESGRDSVLHAYLDAPQDFQQ